MAGASGKYVTHEEVKRELLGRDATLRKLENLKADKVSQEGGGDRFDGAVVMLLLLLSGLSGLLLFRCCFGHTRSVAGLLLTIHFLFFVLLVYPFLSKAVVDKKGAASNPCETAWFLY